MLRPDSVGWICIFTPQTWEQAVNINFEQAALPLLRKKAGRRMRVGQPIFPYITKVQLLAGMLEIISPAIVSPESSAYGVPGQFPVVIKTKPLYIAKSGCMLHMEDFVSKLRLFRGLASKKNWAHSIRLSPRELSIGDTEILREAVVRTCSIS
jgi:hypothetical protein